jgi:cyclic pyranopterin monophosphate synthase
MGMIDITEKPVVSRTAKAEGTILLQPATIQAVRDRSVKKGDVFTVAEIACLSAVKDTPGHLIYCHQIPIDFAGAKFTVHDDRIVVVVTVAAQAKTGVEMEALAGVSSALLTIWDMVKYLEKDRRGQYPSCRMTDIRIISKTKGDCNARRKPEQSA